MWVKKMVAVALALFFLIMGYVIFSGLVSV